MPAEPAEPGRVVVGIRIRKLMWILPAVAAAFLLSDPTLLSACLLTSSGTASAHNEQTDPFGTIYATESPDAERPDYCVRLRVPLTGEQLTDFPALGQYQLILRTVRAHAELAEGRREKRRADRAVTWLQDRLRHPLPAAKQQPEHVHAVGFYEPHEQNQVATVRVSDRSAPVVLILTGYRSINWAVEAADGVQIDCIICSGYYPQKLSSVPSGIPVFYRSYYGRGRDYAYAYGSDRREWAELEAKVPAWTGGLRLSTGQGAYRTDEDVWVIGPENTDWRLQMLLNEVAVVSDDCPTEVDPQLGDE